MALSQGSKRDDVVNDSYVSLVITVSTTEVEAKVGAFRANGRQELLIFNGGSETIYYGPTGVTTSGSTMGIPLFTNQVANIQIGDNLGLFLIAAAANTSVIVQELA